MRAGKIASLLGMEGGHVLENSLGALRAYYDLGARYLTLTHNVTLDWADAANDEPRHDGLSRFGEEVVREMNRLGMLVDLSHVSPGVMEDALRVSEAPVLFSHSSCRALCDVPRNVPDAVLAELPRNGGIVMITFVPGFVSQEVADARKRAREHLKTLTAGVADPKEKARIEKEWNAKNPPPKVPLRVVADHVEHAQKVAGADHIGLGGDFDGNDALPEGLEDVSGYPRLFAELVRRGWSDAHLEKLAQGNVLRVLERAEQVAKRLQAERPPVNGHDRNDRRPEQAVIPADMVAVEIATPGPPDVLRPVRRPVPRAGPAEVLIKVDAAGVNRPDLLQRAGHYPPPPGASDIPGLEVAGRWPSEDRKRSRWAVGDAVTALVAGGGYAEYCVAPAVQCLPIPRGLDRAEAAALPETTFTVWTNVFERGRLQAGEVLLVHGGSSGIGTTAIQMARAFGARVLVTAGTPEKCAACVSLGAERAIDYRREDFEAAVAEATGGPRSRRGPRHGRRSVPRPEPRVPRPRGTARADRRPAGAEGGAEPPPRDAQAPDRDGIHAPLAAGRREGTPRRRLAREGLAEDRVGCYPACDPRPPAPDRGPGGPSAHGSLEPHRQARADNVGGLGATVESSLKSFIDRFRAKPEWQSPDPAVRAAAVLRLSAEERELLPGFAEDPDPRVRKAAVKKIHDIGLLVRLATTDPDPGVREEAADTLAGMAVHAQDPAAGRAALEGLSQPRQLLAVVRTAADPAMRRAALDLITDAKTLAAAGREAIDGDLRLLAVSRLGDPGQLLSLALNSEHKPVALAAADKLQDEAALRAVSERAKSPAAARRARSRLESSGFSTTSTEPPGAPAPAAAPATTTRPSGRRTSRNSTRCARSRRRKRGPWPSARRSAKSWRVPPPSSRGT